MRRGRVRRRRASETLVCLFEAAQPVVLLTDGKEQRGIVGGQFRRARTGLAGQGEIQVARRRDAQLRPQLRHAGELFDQIAVGGQSVGMAALEQMLLSGLPGSHSARGAL